jgi:hypothetical protein
MALRLDPRIPVVWRTPTSLQFGINRPAVVLDKLDLASEKMVAALSSGVSRSGLEMIARSEAVPIERVDALLATLRPVLQRPPRPTPPPIVVAGTGLLADRLSGLLAACGVPVLVAHTARDAEAADATLAVAIGSYVLDPALHALWLRRDVAHLPVILGDTEVVIGPLVEPGRTACLLCLQLHQTDADPAWPAIATQLWGRPSPAETELVASEAAALVARVVLGGVSASTQLLLDSVTGELSRRSFELHPRCGCVGVGEA